MINFFFNNLKEYVELLGGEDSILFLYFQTIFIKGLVELRKNIDSIINLLLIIMEKTKLPCFKNFDMINFRSKFLENKTYSEVKN